MYPSLYDQGWLGETFGRFFPVSPGGNWGKPGDTGGKWGILGESGGYWGKPGELGKKNNQ